MSFENNLSISTPDAEDFSTLWYEENADRSEPTLTHLDPDQIRLVHAALGLATEVGELVDPIKKYCIYGKGIDRKTRENIKEEIGDVLWYLAIIVNHYGFSFQEIMVENIDKLKKRYPEQWSPEAALARADKIVSEDSATAEGN